MAASDAIYHTRQATGGAGYHSETATLQSNMATRPIRNSSTHTLPQMGGGTQWTVHPNHGSGRRFKGSSSSNDSSGPGRKTIQKDTFNPIRY